MIENTRIKLLNQKTVQPRELVVYWMQSSQRTSFNHALEYAIQTSNKLNKFLKVYFVINKSYPEAQNRHFIFMLEGLYEVQKELSQKNIQMILEIGNPIEIISKLSRKSCLIVTDRAYIKTINSWKKEVSNKIDCQLVQVETEAIVPIEEVSNKEEYGAYTIRPKIKKLLGDYLHPLNTSTIKKEYRSSKIFENTEKTKQIIQNLKSVSTSPKEFFYKGGSITAKKELKRFLDTKPKNYTANKNNPSLFDTFITSIENQTPIHVTVVEDHLNLDLDVDDDIVNEAEDTLTIVSNYVDSLDIKTDKNELNTLMRVLYNEALSIE